MNNSQDKQSNDKSTLSVQQIRDLLHTAKVNLENASNSVDNTKQYIADVKTNVALTRQDFDKFNELRSRYNQNIQNHNQNIQNYKHEENKNLDKPPRFDMAEFRHKQEEYEKAKAKADAEFYKEFYNDADRKKWADNNYGIFDFDTIKRINNNLNRSFEQIITNLKTADEFKNDKSDTFLELQFCYMGDEGYIKDKLEKLLKCKTNILVGKSNQQRDKINEIFYNNIAAMLDKDKYSLFGLTPEFLAKVNELKGNDPGGYDPDDPGDLPGYDNEETGGGSLQHRLTQYTSVMKNFINDLFA